MVTLGWLEELYDHGIPAAALAVARFGCFEMVALMRARGETAFFRSMVLGQVKTIRRRRADGTCYPELFTDLQLYRQQFRSWNRVASEMRHAIGGRDILPSPVSQMIRHPDPPAPDGDRFAKGAPMNPMLQHSLAD